MNLDQALEVVAQEMAGEDYSVVERKLLAAVKKVHNIEDLHVYVMHGALHLSTENPRKLSGHPNLKAAKAGELLWRLSSFISGKYSQAYYEGKSFQSLDALKKYRLIEKLSGIG